MKRAIFFIQDLRGAGAQKVITKTANGLNDRGWDISLITIEDPSESFYPLAKGLTRLNLSANSKVQFPLNLLGRFGRFINRVSKMRQVLKDSDYNNAISFLTPINIQLIIATIGLDYKVIISERNDPQKQKRNYGWRILRKMLYSKADFITANSVGVLEHLKNQENLPSNKLMFIPNSISFPESDRIEADTNQEILIIGRLHPQKGHDILFKAYSCLSERIKNKWKVIIVGNGALKHELQKEAHNLNIHKSIKWIGQTKDVDYFYQKAKIFVLPSRYEGQPNVLLEAMSHGLPVIVSDGSPGMTELVRHKENGLIFRSEDYNMLAEHIGTLINDSNLSKKLGENAKKSLYKYDTEKVLNAWESILSK